MTDAQRPGDGPPGVVVVDIHHRYGAGVALDGVGLDVAGGTAAALVGPDGVGKSTLLGLIAGAKRIQGGTVHTLGVDLSRAADRESVQPRIAYMPQGLGKNLYPNLTVRENIAFFARLFGCAPATEEARITPLLQATGLMPFADRLMRKLSGGMKQKLGLCCALVHDPDLLLLDEPTTGVDPLSRREFWALVDGIRTARPTMTLIVATSDMDEAARFERVVMMDAGHILADGPPADLLAKTGKPDLEHAFIALLPEDRRGEAEKPDAEERPIPDDAPVALESRDLTRRFGGFVAVDHVSFKIRKGEIFGFLGSNGCGKTTTMKMMTGLLPADEGQASLFGAPVNPKDIETRRRVGYMSQGFSLYGELTVRQNLDLHADLFGLDAAAGEARVEELSREFDLVDRLDQLSDDLPLGVRQRLSLAVAVLHRPEILILDEPTSGVDPVARDRFWDDLRILSREKGATIFISTHFMAEASRCDRVAFMHAGRVIASGPPEELRQAKNAAGLEEAFIAYMEEGGREAVGDANAAPAAAPIEAPAEGGFRPLARRRLAAYAWRETLELRRDPVRLTFALLGTALLMLIFGYGITMDVDHLRFAVLDWDQTPESRAYNDEFARSSYFSVQPALRDSTDLVDRLKANDIAFAIEVPHRFGADLRRGRSTEVLITVDGAMPFRAETALGYIGGVHRLFLLNAAADAGLSSTPSATVEARYRYNQAFRSLDAMVPATLALLLLFIPSILTALGVVTEKEMGSITNLYVTPVTKLEFLLGKQLPYAALALFNYVVMVVMALLVFGVPIKGSFIGLTLGAVAYVLAATALGLVASTVTRTQVAALFVTALATIVPATQFSGLLQPVSTLSGGGWVIGTLFPATYFLRTTVGAFTKGLSLLDLAPFIAATLAFWPVLLLIAHSLLSKREK